jgi:hypothetical protein
MNRKLFAAIAAAMLAMPAGATTFGLEFWPAVPDRTRQVQHFFSCPVGARLVFKQDGPPPSNAAVGAFVFVGRGMGRYPGLYKIDQLEITRKKDGTVAEVTIGAICTTGIDP